MVIPTNFPLASKEKKVTLLPLSPKEVNEEKKQMVEKRKGEKTHLKAQRVRKNAKKSLISLKRVKKIILAQKQVFFCLSK